MHEVEFAGFSYVERVVSVNSVSNTFGFGFFTIGQYSLVSVGIEFSCERADVDRVGGPEEKGL
jgi:hypothetical protein